MPLNTLTVKALNVGQGDSTHVEFADGRHMLIDINLDRTNNGIDVVQYLKDVLPAASGKQKLDYLVITHPHNDHINGCKELRAAFDIGEMWDSGHELDCATGENPCYDEFVALRNAMRDKGALKTLKASSSVYCTIGDTAIHVLRPGAYVRTDKTQSDDDNRNAIHNECVVLRLKYGSTTVLVTGDTHKAAWESIVKHYAADLMQGDLLLASHHGSRTFFKDCKETDAPYKAHLDAIAPKQVVISVAADSDHGHPHTDMTAEYTRRVGAAQVYQTCNDLTVVYAIPKDGPLPTPSTDDTAFQQKYKLPKPDQTPAAKAFGVPSLIRSGVLASATTVPRENITA